MHIKPSWTHPVARDETARFREHLQGDVSLSLAWTLGMRHHRREASYFLRHVILYGVAYQVCSAFGAQRFHDPRFNGVGVKVASGELQDMLGIEKLAVIGMTAASAPRAPLRLSIQTIRLLGEGL